MTTIQPFAIDISQEVLTDLQQRLQNTRWIQAVKEDAGWDYGIDVPYLEELVDYWQHSYDWHAQEQALNRFNHFKAGIDDYKLHFIHQRGKGTHPIPLLLLHGWPDSF